MVGIMNSAPAVFQGKSTYDQFVAKVNKDGTNFVQTAAGND